MLFLDLDISIKPRPKNVHFCDSIRDTIQHAGTVGLKQLISGSNLLIKSTGETTSIITSLTKNACSTVGRWIPSENRWRKPMKSCEKGLLDMGMALPRITVPQTQESGKAVLGWGSTASKALLWSICGWWLCAENVHHSSSLTPSPLFTAWRQLPYTDHAYWDLLNLPLYSDECSYPGFLGPSGYSKHSEPSGGCDFSLWEPRPVNPSFFVSVTSSSPSYPPSGLFIKDTVAGLKTFFTIWLDSLLLSLRSPQSFDSLGGRERKQTNMWLAFIINLL